MSEIVKEGWAIKASTDGEKVIRGGMFDGTTTARGLGCLARVGRLRGLRQGPRYRRRARP